MNKNYVEKKDGYHHKDNSSPSAKGIYSVDITVRCVRSLWNAGASAANLARRFGKSIAEIKAMVKK